MTDKTSTYSLMLTLLLTATPALSAPPTWPSDLKKALQGKWLSERNARSIEVSGDQVTIVTPSQFPSSYYGPPGSVTATLGDEDQSRSSEHYRFFNGTCVSGATNFKPSPCIHSVNIGEPGQPMLLEVNDDRYWREKDMSSFLKEHRVRKEP